MSTTTVQIPIGALCYATAPACISRGTDILRRLLPRDNLHAACKRAATKQHRDTAEKQASVKNGMLTHNVSFKRERDREREREREREGGRYLLVTWIKAQWSYGSKGAKGNTT